MQFYAERKRDDRCQRVASPASGFDCAPTGDKIMSLYGTWENSGMLRAQRPLTGYSPTIEIER